MRYVDKQFLTQGPHEGGSVFCFIETPLVKNIDNWTLEKGGNIHGSIQIRDCHNQIELDFGAGRQSEYEKRVEKIDHMIEMLSAFRKQYVEMWESHQRDVEFKKKEQGKYKNAS